MGNSTYYNDVLGKWEELRDKLEEFQEQPLSETDGRCKIIDPILVEVLKWEEEHITREPKVSAGFIDYYCSSSENKFIVEAKSTKIDFRLTSSKKYRLVNSFALEKSNPELFDAIQQVRSYGREKDTQFVIASNGLNFAISKTFPGTKKEIDTILIAGKEGTTLNLHILSEIMSPYKDGYQFFLGIIESEKNVRSKPQHTKKKLLTLVYDPSAKRIVNNLSKVLTPYVNRYFSDIAEDKLLVEKLYCENDNLDQYGEEMKAFFKGRVPMLGLADVPQISTSKEHFSVFGQDLLMHMQNYSDGHVFVLFGNVGVGKTTFLKRFYTHILKGESNKKLLWIPVDFQSFYGEKQDVEAYVLKQIEESLDNSDVNVNKLDILKEIYEVEINKKLEGVWSVYAEEDKVLNLKIAEYIETLMENEKEHISRKLQYLKKKLSFSICLIFDNLDQQPDAIQEEATYYSLTKTKEWKNYTILSLRDETYWSMKKRPPMNAYQNITPYQITPPSVDRVLTKRLNFVVDTIGEQEIYFDLDNSKKLTMKLGDIFQIFLDTLKESDARDLLNNLTSGNIRAALDLFKDIVTSHNTNLYNIAKHKYEDSKAKKAVPIDKMIRSIGLSKGDYYSAKESRLLNMYENNLDDGFYSHFINFRILENLEQCAETMYNLDTPSGFIPIQNLLQSLQCYCNNEQALRGVLQPLIEKNLIESDIGARKVGEHDYFQKIKCVRITPTGTYYLKELHSNLQYLELVMFDTMITKQEVYGDLVQKQYSIRKLKKSSNYIVVWELRFQMIELFLKYLKEKEEEDLALLKTLGITNHGKLMPEIYHSYNIQKSEIQKKIAGKKDTESNNGV